MKIEITDKALDWFENEMGLSSGDGVHFYGKVYGKTNVHDGFSLGMEVKKPAEPEYELKKKDISFLLNMAIFGSFRGII